MLDRDLVYPNASGEWVKADADSVNSPVLGLSMGPLAVGIYGRILLRGFVGASSWTWTVGGALYATSTAGEISQTAPDAVRQKIGYAVSTTLIYFDRESVENVIYWSDSHRSIYCPTGGGSCQEVLSGGEWWVTHKSWGECFNDTFNSIFDITALGVASVISNYAYYATKTGAGTFTANTGPSAGMRMTTGATTNNDIAIATGDATGIGLTWNPAQTPWMHLHYRFPNAGDATNVRFLGLFYQDANNYVGIRYDTAIDNNLRLVTRAAAAETLTIVGPLDTDWHEIFVKFGTGEVRFNQDGAVVAHTTNIPTGNFAWYTYLKTGENAAKNYDVALLTLAQDEVEP